MAYHLKIREAANYLACSPRTVQRRIAEGLLDAKQHGPAFTSPTVIPTEQVIALVKLRRNMTLMDTVLAKHDPTWEQQIRELGRRAGKLAEIIGREPILEMLKQYGVARFSDLHPNQLRSMHGALLRLARGLQPYVRLRSRRRRRAAPAEACCQPGTSGPTRPATPATVRRSKGGSGAREKPEIGRKLGRTRTGSIGP
jgi:hypothetical protein